MDAMNRAIENQDSAVRAMIERCQNAELEANKSSVYIEKGLLVDLRKLETKLDARFSVFMKTTADDAAKAIGELRNNVFIRLNALKSRIGELEAKVSNVNSKNEDEEPDVEKMVSEKISQINLPVLIQRELEDLKGDNNSNDINIEKIISERVNKINFSLMIQRELAKLDSQDNGTTNVLDTKLGTAESDISDLKSKSTSNDTKIDELAEKIRKLTLQIETLKTPTIPRPLMSCTMQNRTGQLNENIYQESHAVPMYSNDRESRNTEESLELLLCFDSNGKHIDRRRLWKKNGSEFKTCGTLHSLAEHVKKLTYKKVKHILISVGTNDLDLKDHGQVFGELVIVVDEIRARFQGIKFVINELLPRKDDRNEEVAKFNGLLNKLATSHGDITIATQRNFTEIMFVDNKHLHSSKVPIYAKNIINALLRSYGIKEKKELFPQPTIPPIPPFSQIAASPVQYNSTVSQFQPNDIRSRMKKIANYGYPEERYVENIQHNNINTQVEASNNDEIIRNALQQFSNVILKCIQR